MFRFMYFMPNRPKPVFPLRSGCGPGRIRTRKSRTASPCTGWLLLGTGRVHFIGMVSKSKEPPRSVLIWVNGASSILWFRAIQLARSTLPLFVFRILADDPDDTLALNDLALIAHGLDWSSNLHLLLLSWMTPAAEPARCLLPGMSEITPPFEMRSRSRSRLLTV